MINPYSTINREDERLENAEILKELLKQELKDALKALGTAADNVANAASEYEGETVHMAAFWDEFYLVQEAIGRLEI